MSTDGLFHPDPQEPLSLRAAQSSAPGAYAGHDCLALEFSSRGDRVPGQLVLPASAGAHPVVILAHGLGSARNGDGMDTIGERWVREGAAVAAIDFALHGQRTSPKMTERLFETSAEALGAGFEDRSSELPRRSRAPVPTVST